MTFPNLIYVASVPRESGLFAAFQFIHMYSDYKYPTLPPQKPLKAKLPWLAHC